MNDKTRLATLVLGSLAAPMLGAVIGIDAAGPIVQVGSGGLSSVLIDGVTFSTSDFWEISGSVNYTDLHNISTDPLIGKYQTKPGQTSSSLTFKLLDPGGDVRFTHTSYSVMVYVDTTKWFDPAGDTQRITVYSLDSCGYSLMEFYAYGTLADGRYDYFVNLYGSSAAGTLMLYPGGESAVFGRVTHFTVTSIPETGTNAAVCAVGAFVLGRIGYGLYRAKARDTGSVA